jgi:DNA-binding HxlR family transcriptional regulator
MLTLELRVLEEAGVITRTVIPGRVAHVEYELTEGGRKLVPLINALGDWYKDLQQHRLPPRIDPSQGEIIPPQRIAKHMN